MLDEKTFIESLHHRHGQDEWLPALRLRFIARAREAGVVGVAAGAIVLLAGFIVLLMGVVHFLSQYLTPWAAALLVGAVVMVIGFIMLQAGKKQFEPADFTPDRTVNSLQKDKDAVRRAAQ